MNPTPGCKEDIFTVTSNFQKLSRNSGHGIRAKKSSYWWEKLPTFLSIYVRPGDYWKYSGPFISFEQSSTCDPTFPLNQTSTTGGIVHIGRVCTHSGRKLMQTSVVLAFLKTWMNELKIAWLVLKMAFTEIKNYIWTNEIHFGFLSLRVVIIMETIYL
jgi:hypothetical protein